MHLLAGTGIGMGMGIGMGIGMGMGTGRAMWSAEPLGCTRHRARGGM